MSASPLPAFLSPSLPLLLPAAPSGPAPAPTAPLLTGGLFTSRSDEWYTPQGLVDTLARRHANGRFTLDVAATAASSKGRHFFDRRVDALTQDWHEFVTAHGGGAAWCNPPYSAVSPFMEKAAATARAGTPVVCLIPARIDPNWWHSFVMTAAAVELVHGRVTFLSPTGAKTGAAPFPSAVVVFRPDTHCPPVFSAIGRDGEPLARQNTLPGM